MVEEIKWEWDEEKLEKALEEFKEYLKSQQAKNEYEKRNRRKIKIQKYLENLKNLEDIKNLSINEFREMLKQIYGFARQAPSVANYYYSKENEEKRIEFLMKLVTYDGKEKCPVADNLKVRSVSQILALKEPYKFYIVNEASLNGINSLLKNIKLNDKPEDYPKWRPIFEDLRSLVNEVYKETLGREADFLDVDLFLWWHSEENNDKGEISIERESSNSATQPSLLSQYFQNKGYYFDDKLITAFYAALKTKGFVILSGLSGTGKTKLAMLFAELLKAPYIFLSVRPDWRDGKALLGYYNPLSGEYERTSLLDFILKAIENYNRSKENNTSKEKAQPYFIILDEMNLSHVEYYFADFLSVLESGRDETGFTKESIKLHSNERITDPPSEIKLPPNLYIIGTVNVDETTYMFSPKVLDRAFVLEFREVDLDPPKPELDPDMQEVTIEPLLNDFLKNIKDGVVGVVADKEEIEKAIDKLKEKDKFNELNALYEILQPYDLHFGYRARDEIALFVEYATNVPKGVTKLKDDEAFDFAVLMKVLPKFHGPRQKLEKPLWEVLNWCLKSESKSSPPPSLENRSESSEAQSSEAQSLQNRSERSNPLSLSDFKKEIWKKLTGKNIEPPVEHIANVIVEMSKDEFKGKFKEKLKYPRTAKKVLTMLRQLYETGFASFS